MKDIYRISDLGLIGTISGAATPDYDDYTVKDNIITFTESGNSYNVENYPYLKIDERALDDGNTLPLYGRLVENIHDHIWAGIVMEPEVLEKIMTTKDDEGKLRISNEIYLLRLLVKNLHESPDHNVNLTVKELADLLDIPDDIDLKENLVLLKGLVGTKLSKDDVIVVPKRLGRIVTKIISKEPILSLYNVIKDNGVPGIYGPSLRNGFNNHAYIGPGDETNVFEIGKHHIQQFIKELTGLLSEYININNTYNIITLIAKLDNVIPYYKLAKPDDLRLAFKPNMTEFNMSSEGWIMFIRSEGEVIHGYIMVSVLDADANEFLTATDLDKLDKNDAKGIGSNKYVKILHENKYNTYVTDITTANDILDYLAKYRLSRKR